MEICERYDFARELSNLNGDDASIQTARRYTVLFDNCNKARINPQK